MATLTRSITPWFREGLGGPGVIQKVSFAKVAVNNRWRHEVFHFPDQTNRASRVFGIWRVPSEYMTSAVLVIVPTSLETSGDVDYEIGYRVLDPTAGDSADQTTTQETVSNAWTVPGTALDMDEVTESLTSGNFVAGRLVEMWIEREETSGAGWQIHDIAFRFSDT